MRRAELSSACCRRHFPATDPSVRLRPLDQVAHRLRHAGAGPVRRAGPGLGGRTRCSRRPDSEKRLGGGSSPGCLRLRRVQRPNSPPDPAPHHSVDHRPECPPERALQSGPMSEIVTADEVGDPRDGLRIITCVNGEIMQDGNTADMIFSVGDILAYLSETMTLYPGDLVVTGTPNGVGYTRRPPRLLQPGDEVPVEIERAGSIRNPIVGAVGRSAV